MRKPFFALTLVSLLAATAALSQSASAQTTQYWDRDGATAGFGAGVGTWNLTNTNWSTSALGDVATGAWVQGNDASFGGTVGNVTVDAAIQANSIRLVNTAGAYTLVAGPAPGTLELLSGVIATDTATASTNAQIFAVPITVTGGGDLIVQNNTLSGNSNVALQAAASYGDLRYTSTQASPTGRSQVALNHLQAISPTATIRMDRNGAQLTFASTGVWDGQTFPNNIILNEADSAQAGFLNNIGVSGSYEIEYTGIISSNATGSNVSNLRFMQGAGGGPGALNLHNAASYNGTTTFLNASATATGVIRNSTGADNALPATTRFIYGANNTAPAGAYDVNGRSQTITGISTVAGSSGNIGGVINTHPTNMGTLVINASATHPAYTGNIGVNPLQTAYKAGGGTYTQNDNIAVVLDAASTGTVTFSRPSGMTYSGGTTINGGTLAVDVAGATIGTGNVTVTGGALTISSGVTNAIADTAALSISGGIVNLLGVGYNDVITALTLGGVPQMTPGTYGSTASPATFQDDTYFSGPGVVSFLNPPVLEDADFDGDSDIDGNDFLIWQRGVGVGTTNAQGDANNDNVVDGDDLAIWESDFGTATANAGAIPEPASLALAALAVVGAASFRQSRAPRNRRRSIEV